MRLLIVFLLFIRSGLFAQENDVNYSLLKNKTAVVFFTLKEPMKGKSINQMRIYALSDRYLLIDKTYNAGYLDNLDTSDIGNRQLLEQLANISTNMSAFNYQLVSLFADSTGTAPPEHDINFGGQTYTNSNSSQLIIAYKITGDFLITPLQGYRGLKKLFCFENNYVLQTAIPFKIRKVNRLSEKEAKNMKLQRYPITSYIFVNCD